MNLYVGIASLALVIFGPLLAYVGVLSPLLGFGLFAASALVGLVGIVWSSWRYYAKRARTDAWRAALSLPAVVIVFAMFVGASRYPPINDVTTDLTDPPVFFGDDEPYPADFVDDLKAHYGHLASLERPEAPRVAFDAALQTARDNGWDIGRIDEAALTFEGTTTTSVFKFVDDFVVRVRAANNGSLVDMRSRSRIGRGDMGVNARRIESFFEQLTSSP